MSKKYRIRDGFTFRGDNGAVIGGGDVIELEDDVAALHAHKLELVEDTPKRGAKTKAAATPQDGATTGAVADPQPSQPEDQGAPSTDPSVDPQ
jgi:hypothetical protein